MVSGRRLDFPATRRNREPIFEVLAKHLPQSGLILEIAAGSGQHAAAFAPRLPNHQWQPTDLDEAHTKSADAWRQAVGSDNLLPALQLDATADSWPVSRASAVFSANMVHIAPWAACEGLFRGAAKVLTADGVVILYGPFLQQDVQTSDSNVAFDRSLRLRDHRWGVRDLADVSAVAERSGLRLRTVVAMPANNLTVIFERSGASS
ncbi:MAG: DUF938 domain-containing protein [Myxococcales bacterium]|nr:DUF938 domain-containing protein [Myxococcales bacterium]